MSGLDFLAGLPAMTRDVKLSVRCPSQGTHPVNADCFMPVSLYGKELFMFFAHIYRLVMFFLFIEMRSLYIVGILPLSPAP